VLLVLSVTEPPASFERPKKWAHDLREVLSATLVRDTATRLVFLNLVAGGAGGLVMFWVNQKYWQESGVERYGRRPLLAAVGVLPVIAFFGMASFLGWGGIVFGVLGQVGRGLGGVLFLESLNEKISSAFRATVISLSQLGIRASFLLLGPLVGYGIDAWGLPPVLSAFGILFSIAFVFLLLPLVLRETAPSPAAEPSST
jgi:hypothetical protein